MGFQEFDFALLRGLLEYRVMTAGHITVLFFDGKKEAANKRLQKLKAAGFIGERKRKHEQKKLASNPCSTPLNFLH